MRELVRINPEFANFLYDYLLEKDSIAGRILGPISHFYFRLKISFLVFFSLSRDDW